MAYPVPENEEKRLAALHEYRLLDTAPEEAFDDFTKIAACVFGTPIATITLIDGDRQWFKAKVGVDKCEDSREVSFCAHTIVQADPLVIRDAREDARFSANPLVTGDPHIRFYAGAPLINRDGYALGSLCVVDRHPRELSTEQKDILAALARRVVSQMEFRRVSRLLAESMENLRKAGQLVPIYSWCKGIRDDSGYWETIEQYLSSADHLSLTHGICPECLKIHFPETLARLKAEGSI